MLEIFKAIALDKENISPLYMQLYLKLKEMITQGNLLSEYRLPSIRKLAEILKINQITVVSALKHLEKEGYIYTKPGSGTYVARILPPQGSPDIEDSNIISDELYAREDLALINSGQIKINENTINFASATPTADLFPVEDFKTVLNEVLERDKGDAFSYQDSQGYFPLRESLSWILGKSGITAGPESIQVISGAQQGIDIISKAFLRQGDWVITESPTYTGAIAVFRSRGAEIADIQLETDGPNLSVLEYSLKKYRPKLIYTIPSFQNPTGCSYSNEKRKRILELADKYNAYIIEDDYISDLDFENRKYTPLKAMDRNNRVIFIKSFSKIFMPGLRLGFMLVPFSLQQNILEAKHTTDISTSGLLQRSFDLYIRNGSWDRHLNFMHGIYKERYFEMLQGLDKYLQGQMEFSRPGGGLNLWLRFPYSFPVNRLFTQASAENIVFAPGKIFYSSHTGQQLNNIRLSFASVYGEQIGPGLQKLGEIAEMLTKGNGHTSSMPIL